MGHHPLPTGVLLGPGVLPLYWGAVSVFYSPSRQCGLVICLYIVVLGTAIYHQQFDLTSVSCLHIVEWSNSSFSNNSIWHKSFVSNRVEMWSRSIWPIDRTLSGATTPGQSGPGSDGNEGVLSIPQSSSITEALPSDCLVSYPGHYLGAGVLPLCRDAIGVFCSTSRQGKNM